MSRLTLLRSEDVAGEEGSDPFAGMTIVDADTHLTEPHDLWTSRAPRGWEERLPRVVEVDGEPTWIFDGVPLGRAGASGVIAVDGAKVRGTSFMGWRIEQVHRAAWSIPDRMALMDEQGVWAQILYPNTMGFGGQRFGRVQDLEARLMAVRVFNDAMAEIQEESGNRLVPMAVMPWWDVAASVKEMERVSRLGLRGVNTSSAPHEQGLPDLGDPHWEPFWEAASGLGLPVNFHIGASESSMEWFGTTPWASLGKDQKLGLGSALLYVNNAVVLGNLIYSGVLERHPGLSVVSVESGAGWIPFVLEALDYQLGEMEANAMDYLSMAPSEYFRRQMYACFWFERAGLAGAIDALGPDHLMFETDFPHPTCTYPDGLAFAADGLRAVSDPHVRAQIMGGNASRLYRIPAPA